MNTKQGVVEEVAEFKDTVGGSTIMRASLIGDVETIWRYPISGPLPDVGDVVTVVLSIGDDEPYIDTSVKVFWDSEFTGLHQGTTMISIGMVAETGAMLYCEMTDYDVDQVDEWIFDHVIDHLWCQGAIDPPGDVTYALGRTQAVAKLVREWLEELGPVEMWGDCLAYDWVLFCELFGGAQKIPSNVYYIPFDLATKFKEYGLDPDLDREAYAGEIPGPKHNALHDALVIQACHNRLDIFAPEVSYSRWSA